MVRSCDRFTIISLLLQSSMLFSLGNDAQALTDPIIRIKLKGTVYSDETIIRFKTATTTNFDFQYDANKIMSAGSTPSIYTIINSTNYSINSIPSPDSLPVIQLGSQINETSSYTVSFANCTGLHGYTLYDKFLDREIGIDSSTIYAFEGVVGELLMRFELRYKNATNNRITTSLRLNTNDSSNIRVASCPGGMYLAFKTYNPENYSIKIIGVGGRVLKIVEKENLNTSLNAQFIELSDLSIGTYVVLILADNSESSYHIALL
jgi:hypothetical protein